MNTSLDTADYLHRWNKINPNTNRPAGIAKEGSGTVVTSRDSVQLSKEPLSGGTSGLLSETVSRHVPAAGRPAKAAEKLVGELEPTVVVQYAPESIVSADPFVEASPHISAGNV